MTTQRTTTPKTASRAFRKGLRELKVKDVQEVREGIYRILGVTTKQSFQRYSGGRAVRLDVLKAQQIEDLFAAYGVADCWGE